MAITGAGMANLGYFGILPMGISNYGGDTQVYNIPQYASSNVNLCFNPMAQMSLGNAFGGGMGIQPLNLQIDVNGLTNALLAPVMEDLATQSVNTNTQGASTLETRLKALLEAEGVTDEDKTEINALIEELKEQQTAMKNLEESGLSNSDIYKTSDKITQKLTEISKKASKISQRISGYDASSESQGVNDDDSSDEAGSPRRGSVKSGLSGSEYGPEFLDKVKKIAKKINCDYKDLLGVMNSESGINAKAKNPHSTATGLIQFMDFTAKSLGTTCSALRKMSPIKQLDYVEKFLKQQKKAAGFSSSHKLDGGELYALVFLPARAKREVLTQRGEKYYAANKGLDKNKDGKITQSELDARVRNLSVSDSSFYA
ncbi:MAG: transglycosylase SLT domain-containing protein [Muribaculaceae bacterium]|nr:transglycosylase SLT domain-containing protein [Muribaculaceae bacterium]